MRKEDYTTGRNEHNNDNNSYNKRHSKACCVRDYGSQIRTAYKSGLWGPLRALSRTYTPFLP